MLVSGSTKFGIFDGTSIENVPSPPPLAVKKKKHHAFSKLGSDPRTRYLRHPERLININADFPSIRREVYGQDGREKNKEIKTG